MRSRLLHLIPVLAFIVLLFSTIFAAPMTAYAVNPSVTSANSDPDFKIECDNKIFNPLKWMVCPVVDGLTKAIGWIDIIINSQMTIGSDQDSTDPNQIFCNSKSGGGARKSCTAYYNAWANVRDIALGLMVIVGIIVLIAQAVGLEILDAYTIRKVMPRLVIAAVAITLSWQLMQFFVTLSNDLGFGVRYIIYQPFVHFDNPVIAGGGNVVGTILSLGALTALGFIGLLSYLATAALAVFVGFIVLVLRELLIIMLIIFAPIAIVAYILPNTQKYFKFWWESFSKALLMFVMISALIATGRVVAVVAGVGVDNDIPAMAQLVAFVAYFLPYILIPFTFKFAGTAMSTIAGAVQSRSEGGFKALSGYRGNVAKKNLADLKSGNRLHGEGRGGLGVYSAFARNFNRATAGTANLGNAGYNPRRMRQRMGAARSTRLIDEAKEAMEKNANVKALTADDDLVEASNFASDEIRQGSRRSFESLVREDLDRRGYHNTEQGVALVRSARNSMNSDAYDSAMGIAAFGTSSGLTPTYETDPDTGEQVVVGGGAAGREMINRIAGNDRQRAIQMLGASRQLAESKGRFDLVGGSFTEDAELLDDMHNGNVTQNVANQRLLRGALDGTGRGRIFGGHRRNIDAMAPQVRTLLDESFGLAQRPIDGGQAIGPGTAGNPQEVIQQLAFAANALDAASSNSAESARVVNDQVLSQEVNLATLHPEVLDALGSITYARDPQGNVLRDPVTQKPFIKPDLGVTTYGHIIEALRTDENFGRYRREYSSARDAASGAQTPPPAGP